MCGRAAGVWCLDAPALALPGRLEALIELWLGITGVADRPTTGPGPLNDSLGMYICDI